MHQHLLNSDPIVLKREATGRFPLWEGSTPSCCLSSSPCALFDYPPVMSSTPVLPDSVDETFARLLERLAQRVENDDVEAGTDTRLSSERLPRKRSWRNASIPKARPADGGRDRSSEGLPLSYEEALRAHSRRQPAMGADITEIAFVARTATVATKVTTPSSPRRGTRDQPKSESSCKHSKNLEVKGPSKQGQQSTPIATIRCNPKNGRKVGSAGTKLQPSSPFGEVEAPAGIVLKKTSLSIRVTMQESNQLRLRAAEVGLSVAAYMRLCVLETEMLRVQVKQALVDLRTGTLQAQPVTLPAPRETGSSAFWFRFLFKPVTFFLGPLSSLRRSV